MRKILLVQNFVPGYGVFYAGKKYEICQIYGEFIKGKNACQSSLVDTATALYIIPLQNNLTHGFHRSFSFGVIMELWG